jgi:3-(3-hydroxy-phenyl)propionate hydroxylase
MKFGQMMPQPTVSAAQGNEPFDAFLFDAFLPCHQWLVLGVGIHPVSMLSARDLAVLDALQARFVCLNGGTKDARTLSLQCVDTGFADGAKRHQVRAVLVRPDRFIAARLEPEKDISALTPFTLAKTAHPSRVAPVELRRTVEFLNE